VIGGLYKAAVEMSEVITARAAEVLGGYGIMLTPPSARSEHQGPVIQLGVMLSSCSSF